MQIKDLKPGDKLQYFLPDRTHLVVMNKAEKMPWHKEITYTGNTLKGKFHWFGTGIQEIKRLENGYYRQTTYFASAEKMLDDCIETKYCEL